MSIFRKIEKIYSVYMIYNVQLMQNITIRNEFKYECVIMHKASYAYILQGI